MQAIYLFLLLTGHSCLYALSPCKPGDTRLPHPKQCQLYYDCELTGQPYPWLEDNIVECPYPLLFDATTNSCEFFTQVDCGKRYEPINGCEYENNQCHGSHCRPCWVDYPECKGLPDGPNPIKHKEGTPFFAICFGGRFVKEEMCPKDEAGRYRIYDHNSNTCDKPA